MSIEFIERVDISKEFRDALDMSKEVVRAGLDGDIDKLAASAQFIFPKLRFVWLNIYRYVFASRFLRDNDFVIDVPCGTGYGTAVLASNGNEVLGIDIDEATVQKAADTYQYPNMWFKVGDMLEYKFPKADFITCLDGLEHVEDGERLITRFRESLTDSGILVVTVPINETVITGGEENPFHKHEYTVESLRDLLSTFFDRVTLFGHDIEGSISDVAYAFDGIMAVCEV